MAGYEYEGHELELFEKAVHWKAYFRAQIARYLVGDVLEVGAGFGATARVLCDGRQRSWTSLEPDGKLIERMQADLAARPLPSPCAMVVGTLADLAPSCRFDAVIYIDVLEHIADDAAELRRAAQRLRPGGRIVVLSPAHQWLYTDFDRAIGHHRRYSIKTLAAVGPPPPDSSHPGAPPDDVQPERFFYLDSVGMLASLGNRLLLKKSMPNPGQLKLWDSLMVPLSRRVFDPLLGRSVGKSVVGVWRNRLAADAESAKSRPVGKRD
jgi:SAM-dependent methyltransferase